MADQDAKLGINAATVGSVPFQEFRKELLKQREILTGGKMQMLEAISDHANDSYLRTTEAENLLDTHHAGAIDEWGQIKTALPVTATPHNIDAARDAFAASTIQQKRWIYPSNLQSVIFMLPIFTPLNPCLNHSTPTCSIRWVISDGRLRT
jgi:hypothetical protein